MVTAHRNQMRSYLLVFMALALYACSAFGQTQGNGIQLIDSFVSSANNPALNCGSIGNCVQYPEQLHVGDVVVVGAGQENATCAGGVGVSNPPWTVSDTLGNTITNLGSYHSGGGNGYVQLSCVQVTNSGTDQITVSGINHANGCANSIAFLRFKNASCTVDGSPVTSTSASISGTSSTSTSTTTTVNGDVLVSVGMQTMGTQANAVVDGTSAMYGAFSAPGNGFGNTLMEYRQTGNLGTYSMGMASCCNAAPVQVFMQTIALKPAATIAIADTVLPDAAQGVSYSAQLHCIGGILAPTYSLFSGSFPSGISLNTSTGAITGSTASAGTSTLQFKCTDGTSTSAAQTLTLKVGAAFNSIVVKNAITFDGDQQPGFQTISASCGDLIVVMPNGADTHHGIGWMPATSGANSAWTDSFGSPVQRLTANAGWIFAPYVAYVFGPLPTSGIDTINYQNNGGGSSGLPPVLLMDISGAQAVLDPGATNSTSAAPTTSISESLTTPVANELALVASLINDTGAGFSFSSPFSLISAPGTGNPASDGFSASRGYASALIASPSSVTATTNFTTSAGGATSLLMALRPALPLACQFIGAGEPKRRSAQ